MARPASSGGVEKAGLAATVTALATSAVAVISPPMCDRRRWLVALGQAASDVR